MALPPRGTTWCGAIRLEGPPRARRRALMNGPTSGAASGPVSVKEAPRVGLVHVR